MSGGLTANIIKRVTRIQLDDVSRKSVQKQSNSSSLYHLRRVTCRMPLVACWKLLVTEELEISRITAEELVYCSSTPVEFFASLRNSPFNQP